MTAEYLTELIRTVIVNLTKSGFIVFSVLSDNNVVNRKAFISLSRLPTSQQFFYNPVNNAKVYVLFDSVYILKCIKNNWLTLYDPGGGGGFKSPPPPIVCPHAFNFGATLLCVGDFFQKNSLTPCSKKSSDWGS